MEYPSLHLRITKELKFLLIKQAKKRKCSLSEYVVSTLTNSITDIKEKEHKKILEEEKRARLEEMARDESTKNARYRHHIGNTLQRLYALAKNSLILTDSEDIGMETIRAEVKMAFKVYNTFPKKIKKELKQRMEYLKNFNNESFAFAKYKAMKRISEKEKKKLGFDVPINLDKIEEKIIKDGEVVDEKK